MTEESQNGVAFHSHLQELRLLAIITLAVLLLLLLLLPLSITGRWPSQAKPSEMLPLSEGPPYWPDSTDPPAGAAHCGVNSAVERASVAHSAWGGVKSREEKRCSRQ